MKKGTKLSIFLRRCVNLIPLRGLTAANSPASIVSKIEKLNISVLDCLICIVLINVFVTTLIT